MSGALNATMMGVVMGGAAALLLSASARRGDGPRVGAGDADTRCDAHAGDVGPVEAHQFGLGYECARCGVHRDEAAAQLRCIGEARRAIRRAVEGGRWPAGRRGPFDRHPDDVTIGPRAAPWRRTPAVPSTSPWDVTRIRLPPVYPEPKKPDEAPPKAKPRRKPKPKPRPAPEAPAPEPPAPRRRPNRMGETPRTVEEDLDLMEEGGA